MGKRSKSMDKSSRSLGTAGHKGCKFGCLYCFTREPQYKRCPRLDILRTRDLVNASIRSKVVQPACDTEFLFVPNWRDYLDELVSTGKTISFATKMDIYGTDLQFLSEMNKILMANGNVLNIGVTIVRLRDWKDLEPRAPSPFARIASLCRLWDAGIPTMVLMRPMIPLVTFDEIDELVEKTYRFCYGYLSGPLYLTPAMEDYLKRKKIPVDVKARIAKWQKGQPQLRVVESVDLEKHLLKVAESKGRKLFNNNIEAAVFVNDFCKQEWTGDLKWSTILRHEPVGTVYVFNPNTKEFLMIFHRKLGKWLPPGGHVEDRESTAQAAIREVKEELGLDLNLIKLKGKLNKDGKNFRRVDCEPGAFCTIEEFIHPIGAQDPHIHVDSIYVAIVTTKERAEKRDKEEVTARDWYSISKIEHQLDTFDNVPDICHAILRAIDR